MYDGKNLVPFIWMERQDCFMVRKDKKGRKLRVGEYYDSVNDRYVYKRMVAGKRYSLTDTDLASLRKKEANLIAEIENGNIYNKKMNEMTLDQYYECWCKNAGKSSRKATTFMNYQAYYKAHVLGTELGRMQMGKIRKMHCQKLFNEMIQNGCKKSTLSNMKGCLSAIFSEAEDDDAIVKNPCKNIKFTNVDAGEREAIPEEQVRLLVDFLKQDEEFAGYYPFFVVLFNLGTRVGETCALTWDAVDFSRSQVTIDKSLNRYRKKEYGFTLAIGTTKSRKGVRTIAVNEAVINALKRQKQLQMQILCPAGKVLRVDDYGRVIGEINNLVFTQVNGNAWYEPAIISLIHRIVKKQNDFAESRNGKKLEYFTPHQIRHTYTTMAYEAGIDEKEVAFRLGHSSEVTTRDVYTHLRGNKKQEQEAAVNKIWIS